MLQQHVCSMLTMLPLALMMQQLQFRLETHPHPIHHGLTITTGPSEPVRRGYNITACSQMTGILPKQKVPIAGLSGTAQTD